jgi:guanylate kinase
MNLSESLLWDHLKGDQLGVRFRTQYAVEGLTLDFYCAKLRLCIEVDGEVHQYRQASDQARDQKLNELGIHVMRISTFDLWEDVDAVVRRIQERIANLTATR